MSLAVEQVVSTRRDGGVLGDRSPVDEIWNPTEAEIEEAIRSLSDLFDPELAATIVRSQVGRPRLSDEAFSREAMYE